MTWLYLWSHSGRISNHILIVDFSLRRLLFNISNLRSHLVNEMRFWCSYTWRLFFFDDGRNKRMSERDLSDRCYLGQNSGNWLIFSMKWLLILTHSNLLLNLFLLFSRSRLSLNTTEFIFRIKGEMDILFFLRRLDFACLTLSKIKWIGWLLNILFRKTGQRLIFFNLNWILRLRFFL